MLKNDVVSLRPITYDDAQLLNKWRLDYDTFKYLGGGYNPISADQQRKWMDNVIDNTGKNRRYMIENTQGDTVGYTGLYDINFVNGTCELGLVIGETDCRGKGYGINACRLLCNYARGALGLRKVKVFVVEENTAAVKLYEKVGFVRAGTLHKERLINGEYKNVLIMELFLNM